MNRVWHYLDGKLYPDPNDDVTEYLGSLRRAIRFIRDGYYEQGYSPISGAEALEGILASGIPLVFGKTWVAGYVVEKPWHLHDTFCCEEFYAPRYRTEALDLEDFIAGSVAFAANAGAGFFEFGTRSNSRHIALARLCQQHDADISAITLTKVIPYGLR